MSGDSVLAIAVLKGNLPMVKLLLDYGAELTAEYKEELLQKYGAARLNYIETVIAKVRDS